MKELNEEKVAEIFEESWGELVDEYFEHRIIPVWCSEGDIQLHLAHTLLNKLPFGYVHIELPIPIDIERFTEELFWYGRIRARKCIRPDIVIVDPDELLPSLIAEIKFTPVYWGFYPVIYAVMEKKEKGKEVGEEFKNALKKSIDYLKGLEESGPSERELENVYIKNVNKLIKILTDFETKERKMVNGYLCVIDEIYPDIEERLKKEIEKYNPPSQFKLLVQHHPTREILEKSLAKLQEP